MKVDERSFEALKSRLRGRPAAGSATKGARLAATQQKARDASPCYRSKLEAAYATYLHGLQHAGEVHTYAYECITIKLAKDVRYTPDFYVRFKDGSEEYHEIKGYSKGLMAGKGMVKLRLAAEQWPSWTFVLITHERGAWTMREL